MRYLLLALPLSLAACMDMQIPNDIPGQVVAMNSQTVTVRGAFNSDGTNVFPPPAVATIAAGACRDPQYLSASHYHEYLFDYLFQCQR